MQGSEVLPYLQINVYVKQEAFTSETKRVYSWGNRQITKAAVVKARWYFHVGRGALQELNPEKRKLFCTGLVALPPKVQLETEISPVQSSG